MIPDYYASYSLDELHQERAWIIEARESYGPFFDNDLEELEAAIAAKFLRDLAQNHSA